MSMFFLKIKIVQSIQKNVFILFLIIICTLKAHSFSYSCTVEDLKLNRAGFEILRKKSFLDYAAVLSGLIAISPAALHSRENPNGKPDEGKIGFAVAGMLYGLFGSWPSGCQNWEKLETPKVDVTSVRQVYERSKRTFWISYALSAVTLYDYSVNSIYEDRRNYAKVAFLIPLALTFLGEWNLIHSPTDEEISPLIVTTGGEVNIGLNYRMTF